MIAKIVRIGLHLRHLLPLQFLAPIIFLCMGLLLAMRDKSPHHLLLVDTFPHDFLLY